MELPGIRTAEKGGQRGAEALDAWGKAAQQEDYKLGIM
jgi:hypothetical protein